MKITNNCSFEIIVVGWHTKYGYGNEVEISPGKSGNISGPYIGEMDDGSCHIAFEGPPIVCHQESDDDNGFHVSEGNQLVLSAGDERGITIRHFSEDIKSGQ